MESVASAYVTEQLSFYKIAANITLQCLCSLNIVSLFWLYTLSLLRASAEQACTMLSMKLQNSGRLLITCSTGKWNHP